MEDTAGVTDSADVTCLLTNSAISRVFGSSWDCEIVVVSSFWTTAFSTFSSIIPLLSLNIGLVSFTISSGPFCNSREISREKKH